VIVADADLRDSLSDRVGSAKIEGGTGDLGERTEGYRGVIDRDHSLGIDHKLVLQDVA
jgi:hypothetical protein